MYLKRVNGYTYYCMSVRTNGRITTAYLGRSIGEAEQKERILREELGISHRGRPHRNEENPRFVHHNGNNGHGETHEMKSQARPLIIIPILVILCTAFLLRAETTGLLTNISENLSENLSQNLSDFLNGSFEPLTNLSGNISDSNATLNETLENQTLATPPENTSGNGTNVTLPESGISSQPDNDSAENQTLPLNITIPEPNLSENLTLNLTQNPTQNITENLSEEDQENLRLGRLKSRLESKFGIQIHSLRKHGNKQDVEFSRNSSRFKLSGVNPEDLTEIREENIPRARIHSRQVPLNTGTIFLNSLPLESAEITLQKTGPVNAILKCTDFSGSDCLNWESTGIPFTDSGSEITFTVTSFSGYAGAYITILNVQSYPTVGGEWTVAFTTNGTADLTISASNGTSYGSDLEWLSLSCGSETLQPDFDGTRIFYPNWSCQDTGFQTVRVLTSGSHTQEFIFGDQTEYAHNWAKNGNVYNCSSCSDCNDAIANASSGDIIQLNTSISNQAGTCISFGGADNLTFDCLGNTIDGDDTGTDYGIWLNDSGGGSNNNTIRNCAITDFYNGVYVQSSTGNNLTNITASSSVFGVEIESSAGTIVRNVSTQQNTRNFHVTGQYFQDIDTSNTVEWNRPIYYWVNRTSGDINSSSNAGMVWLINCTNITVRDVNVSYGNYIGILLYQTTYSNFTNITSNSHYLGFYLVTGSTNNVFTDIVANSCDQAFYIVSSNNTIRNFAANYNSYALYLNGGSNNIIDNMTAGGSYRYDVLPSVGSDSDCMNTVSNSTGSGGRPIRYYSSAVNLSNDTLSELVLCNADNSIIENVTVRGSGQNNGIMIARTDYATLREVNSSYNYDGFYIYDSYNNTFTNVTASSNANHGIRLSSNAGSNVINNSRIERNTVYGISISSYLSAYPPLYNRIYNNIINNTVNLYSDSANNLNYWNVTRNCSIINIIGGLCIGGNLWTSAAGNFSDACADADADGICDSSYALATNNTDYLPLTDKPPLTSFYTPTPDNGTFFNSNWAYVNVSTKDANEYSTFLDWNRSLVGWWRFNQESGENGTFFRDWSTWGNNGTCTGGTCPNYSDGKFGKGLSFDGADDYVTMGSLPQSTILTTNQTVSFWFKPNVNITAATGRVDFISRYGGPFASYGGMAGGAISYSYYNSAVQNGGISYASNFSAGVWYHFVGVHNASNAYLYINGVSVGTPSNIDMTAPYSGTYETIVGALYLKNAAYVNAVIDDVQIFSRALSPEEINASYNAGLYRLYHNFTGLADGQYTYRAYAQDVTGNINSTEQRQITVDLTAPSISFASPTDGNNSIFSRTWSYVNASTSDANPGTMLLDWNRSLVGWWRFNNESGENSSFFRDWSTWGKNGTCSGGTCPNYTDSGKFGKGLSFDGTDDYVLLPDSSRPIDDFTVSMWFKLDKEPSEFSPLYPNLIGGQGLGVETLKAGFALTFNSGGGLIFDAYNTTNTKMVSSATGVWGTGWHFIAATRNSTTQEIWIDGTKEGSGASVSGHLDWSGKPLFRLGYGYRGYFDGAIDDVRIFSRSLSSEEINASFNSGSYRLTANFTGLAEGNHTYTTYSQDLAGNVNSTMRTVKVDMTSPDVSFVFPTPDNNTGRSFQFEVNATISDLHFANVTYNWNGANTTYNTSQPEITYSGGNMWTFSLLQTNLSTGATYTYYVLSRDIAGNTNQTEVRTVVGNVKPGFVSMTRTPSSEDDMDPNVTLTIVVNVSDTDNNFDSAILQWKNASADWSQAQNVSMLNLTAKGFWTNLTASFTPAYEANYSYRIWANDTEGEWNTSVTVNISVFYDWTWTVDRSNLGNTVAGVFEATTESGNFTIINTGDYNMSFSMSDNSPYDPEGYAKGCGLLYNGSCQVNLDQIVSNQSSKGSKAYVVNATFGGAAREDFVTITILGIPQVNASPQSRTVNVSLASYAGGPYFDASIDTYPAGINQSGTASLGAYVKNIGNETAQNVTIAWTVPGAFGVSGNTTEAIGNMSPGSQNTSLISITADPLTTAAGTYTIHFSAGGQGSVNASDSDSVTITVYCTSGDSVCGAGCTYQTGSNLYDSDCSAPPPVVITEPGTSGGAAKGGGLPEWQKQKLFQTQETYELVRRMQQEFILRVENPFEGAFENVSVEISGFLNQYLSVTPAVISGIPVKQSRDFTISITAPKYFSKGTYSLNFTITGTINRTTYSGNTTTRMLTPVREHRLVTLIVHEISEGQAHEYLNQTREIIGKMGEAGLNTRDLAALLSQAESRLLARDFESSRSAYEKARDEMAKGMQTLSTLGEIEQLLQQAQNNEISTPKTERLAALSRTALERGDFDSAMQRANDAKFTYALESVGEFNVVAYLRNNWPMLSILFALSAAGLYIGSLSIRFRLMGKRLKSLKKEEEVLLGLIRESQKDCFEGAKLSMKEYMEGLVQYEKKMSMVVQEIVRLEIRRANMLKLTQGEQEKLIEERKRLLDLIKETQVMYLETGKIETRIYENKMRSYAERMAEIEESIASIEAKRAMKG